MPLCSEITWQFSVKRSIIQMLLGMLRLLNAGGFSGAAVGHLFIMDSGFGLLSGTAVDFEM